MIRPATNADCEEITALVNRVLAEYGLKPDPESTDADLRDIEGNYAARGGAFEVYEDSSAVILGTVGVFPLSDSECELRKMYLLPEARGQGIGKQLLQHSLEKARELGFTTMFLETADVLKEAVRLYRRFGFEPTTSEHLSPRCDQAFRKDLLRVD